MTYCLTAFIIGGIFCEHSRDGNCVFERLAMLQEDEVPYNVLRQKAVQYISVHLLNFLDHL
jgi:hypothetical protein